MRFSIAFFFLVCVLVFLANGATADPKRKKKHGGRLSKIGKKIGKEIGDVAKDILVEVASDQINTQLNKLTGAAEEEEEE